MAEGRTSRQRHGVPKDFMAGVPKVTLLGHIASAPHSVPPQGQGQPAEVREFIDIEIDNIWFHVSTNTKINLQYIDHAADCSSTFLSSGELQLQLQDSEFSVILNKRGTVRGVAGCVTEAAAALAAMKAMMLLKTLGYHIRAHNFRITNVVARGQVPFRIDIKSLHQDNKKHLQYKEREKPAKSNKIYKRKKGPLECWFSKRKIKSPNVEKLLQASKYIYPRLRPYAVLPTKPSQL
ncbi:TATA box-binding protein-like protein 1 [Portunus trituberculatus]|uniref:TATA box-binding protein-like protein 1 n=1 Tax=Portunus trituberculatus TaxID=210409 RepID=A0A5B7E7Y9_PORTR|nr:TATA box-binding protein-like protein 1 [Portunus trituberculatus]